MSETRGSYTTVYASPSNSITCARCGKEIGTTTEMGGRRYLVIGGAVLYSAHGVCGACGEAYHWSTTDQQLQRLIGRMTGGKHELF